MDRSVKKHFKRLKGLKGHPKRPKSECVAAWALLGVGSDFKQVAQGAKVRGANIQTPKASMEKGEGRVFTTQLTRGSGGAL